MDKTWTLQVIFYIAAIVSIGRSQEDCEVNILEDDVVFVPFNQLRWLNCSYTCPSAIWKTRLSKENNTNGINWVATEVKVDDWEESKASCSYPDKNKKTEITVWAYALAEQVTINMQEDLEEGRPYTVTCTAFNVAPKRFLNISLTRGGEVIYSKKYENDTSTPDALPPVVETFEFTASREDNLQDFACQATLDLGTIPNTTVQSPSVTVRAFALPEDPVIKVNKWIENGTQIIGQCVVSKAFPPQNVTLQLMVNEMPYGLDTSVMSDGTVWGSITLRNYSYHLGQNNVTCISQVKGLTRSSTVSVNMYEVPKVDMSLSNQTMDYEDTVTADCAIANAVPDEYCVVMSVDEQPVLEGCEGPLRYNLTADHRRPAISVTCLVYIKENQNISRTFTETIAVYYPPHFSDELCPISNTWVEGQEVKYPCRSEGNPSPTVHCSFLEETEGALRVTRHMAGDYECEAANSKGTARRNVSIAVHYPPESMQITLSTDAEIRKGDSFNVTCQSDAFPAPEYSWELPSGNDVTYSEDKGTITVNTASSAHAGMYTCEAKNHYGTLRAQHEVNVKRDSIPYWIWIIVGVGVATVLFLLFAIILLRKKGKKGFYSLLSGSNKKRQENGLKKEKKEPAKQKTTPV